MSGIIGIISATILFILCIIGYRKIQVQHEELLKLYRELENEKELNKKLISGIDYNEKETKAKIIPILEKIQKRYRVTKKDKIYLLDYFSHLIHTFRHYEILDIIYTMDLTQKFTFKEATNNIIDFINHKHNKNIQEVTESIFYLIIK